MYYATMLRIVDSEWVNDDDDVGESARVPILFGIEMLLEGTTTRQLIHSSPPLQAAATQKPQQQR